MSDASTRRHALASAVVAHVRHAAGDTPLLMAGNYRLGETDVIVDLAIAADEFIAIVIHLAGDPLGPLGSRLTLCRRYFDRVAAVTESHAVGAVKSIKCAGSAVWACTPGGAIVEHVTGTTNTVNPIALLDLMSPRDRTEALRRLLPHGSTLGRLPVAVPPSVNWRSTPLA